MAKPRQGNPAVYVGVLMLIGLMLGPVLYIIIGGFRTNSQITTDPAGLPDPWVFSNYTDVLAGETFWRQVGNSTIAAVITTIGVVGLGVMASYVLARYRFRGRGVMYALFAAGLMFPATVAITPLYILIKNLGLVNTLPGVILPQIAFGLPTTIIILVPFLRAIPREIEEAAAIDQCSRLGFFWRMVLPLSVPGLITTGILAFVNSWNSYLLPLFILNDQETFTLPLGVQAFASEYSVDTAKVLAFTSLSMIPALVFFSLFERRIVGGLTGAVKG
ncbi:raffinose/stachyose/melibiose transport system permease protein [Actinoplanes campanulatus]|uniref:Raffinose/stachyose/melibiose transport system permease protein n=1 Tax=Actinoplanes campanulatus TaxID=113559 RepID=A0A7W5AD12_9ACTN|nr:carbohydrate ABC transporter permease [Actinoplanes campanulatus]MBB3094036.1 raffinose/stachyose/melibiose transport system permease protein [Actinoplanes campanulatus]GGN33153.1 sugar ABC transporter permease [Actinoplanes campanulatus]GID38266.1 sugar ABC transporter permease [Actinoplanes campanulatus]